MHNIGFKSEKRVVRKIIQQIQKLYGRGKILFGIAETCLAGQDQTIRGTSQITNEKALIIWSKFLVIVAGRLTISLEKLEPSAVKIARWVLRGWRYSNLTLLPDK